MTSKVYPKLTKYDQRGHQRFYWGEVEGEHYRTFSQRDVRAVPVPSAWTSPRVNMKRTPHQQCHFEMEAIYAKRDRMGWRLNSPKSPRSERAEETWYSPMLAQKYPHIKAPPSGHWAQPKLDGIRCTASREGLVSRKNVLITSVPHIERQVKAYLEDHPEIFTLDGELYVHGLDLHDISGRARRKKPDTDSQELQFHIFDCETQWASETFNIRWSKLQSVKSRKHLAKLEHLHMVDTQWCDDAEDRDFLHAKWIRAGYEGSIYRDPHGPYVHKRTKFLLKRKDFIEREFTVIGIREGNGAWRGCAKAIDYVDDRGEEFESGIRGTQAYLRTVLKDRAKIIGSLGTVRYFSLTPKRKVPYLPVTVNLGRWDLEEASHTLGRRWGRIADILGKKQADKLLPIPF